MKLIKSIFFLCFFLVSASTLFAATYYIDWGAGNDTNVGSKASPWKRHPYMIGYSGRYVHSPGDQFIFKGGVSWTNSVFPMVIANGGSSESIRDYYGVDKTWYTGGSWNRPIFTCGGSVCDSQISIGASYITIDNIESTGIHWNASTMTGFVSIDSGQDYITVSNCYIHGWTHDANAGDGFSGSGFVGILSPAGLTGTCIHCLVDHLICDGITSNDSGYCIYNMPNVSNSTLTNVPNGIVAKMISVHDNDIGPIVWSFAGTHENAIEELPCGDCMPNTVAIYNNYVHTNGVGMPIFPDPCNDRVGATYVFNNVVWGTNTYPITIDTNCTGERSVTYIYNNTLECSGGPCIRVNNRGSSLGTLTLKNNHYINASGSICYNVPGNCDPVTTFSEPYKLVQSAATAAAQGYTSNNRYAPTLGGATIDPSGDTSVTCTGCGAAFANDILGIARPQGTKRDIGAYEHGASLDAPLNLRIVP